jgi:hypothetical protein
MGKSNYQSLFVATLRVWETLLPKLKPYPAGLSMQGGLGPEGYRCTQGGELLLEALVATQDVAGTVHYGGPFGD